MLTAIGDVMRKLYDNNWITTRDGNISLIKSNSKTFYITPSGWRKTIIHPEHLLRMTMSSNGIKMRDKSSSTPSGELDMHYLLQKDYSGTRAIVHAHPTYTIACMLRGFNLIDVAIAFPELSRYTRLGETVQVLPVISTELAIATAKAFQVDELGKVQCDIVGQAGHGVCSIARDPWSAYEHIERLEHICKIVLISGVKPSDFE
tara:strand:- start:645 stop:1256 length:612 start_codon:yes stop_codon:yes gene_type:complete